jgi:hypothetical protein
LSPTFWRSGACRNQAWSDFIALFTSLACKSGSVAGDGTAVSTTANSVFLTHVEAEAI